MGTVKFDIVSDLGEKGRTFPPARLIEVDSKFWGRMNHFQKAAFLAHELAHLEPGPARRDDGGEPCESCADKRAGAIMAAWGFSRLSAVNAAGTIIDSRAGAPSSYATGWDIYTRSTGVNI
jgi:hypothetical protein